MSASETIDKLSKKNLPPGPPGIPLLGNLFQTGTRDILDKHIEFWKQYGDLFYLKLGPLNGYVISNPEDVHYVLVKNQKNYIKGIGYDSFRLLVGQGLVTSDGELWRQQRRLTQPSFTPTAVVQFSDMMADMTHCMLDRWQTAADQGDSFMMDEEMMRLTMSIIGRAMFSIDLGKELTEVGTAFQEAFAFLPSRAMNPLTPLSLPLPSHRRFRRNLATINRFIDERITAARRQDRQDNLVSILLRAQDEDSGRQMDAQQLRDEVVTLFFAGFETTARSLTWGWYLLAKHPAVMQKLADEADTVLNGRFPKVADLHQLSYTRMVVDEVLRLYPPTALLARQNIEDDEIGGYYIPAGSLVTMVPYLVHRHPTAWRDPEQFDPERFNPEMVAGRSKFAYIPFSTGPRICLGNNFALMEMIYAFAMTAGRYRVEMATTGEISYEFAGTIRPTRPLYVKLLNRTQ